MDWALTWDDLLKLRRVLIVSEVGAGKTYECRAQRDQLTLVGGAAFVLELMTLAKSSVRDMLGAVEEERFDEWLASSSDVATFFLPSIDDLKLTRGSFKQALIRLAKAVSPQLRRTRVVIASLCPPADHAPPPQEYKRPLCALSRWCFSCAHRFYNVMSHHEV